MKNQFLFFSLIGFILVNSCKKEIIINNYYQNFSSGSEKTPDYDNLPMTTAPSSGSGGLPSTKDLSPLMPDVRHQKSQGSCVAFCLSYSR